MSKGNVEDRDASHTVESPYCGKHPIWVIRDNLAVSNLGRDSQQLRVSEGHVYRARGSGMDNPT